MKILGYFNKGKEYAIAVAAVAICTLLSFGIYPFFELTNLVMIYLLGTLTVATRGHRAPAAVSAILSVLCFDFFFVPPRFTFSVADIQYTFTFMVMFVTAMIISHLTIRLRSEAETAKDSQIQTSRMQALTQQLVGQHDRNEIVRIATHHLDETFQGKTEIFLPSPENPKLVQQGNVHSTNEKSMGVAQWVFDRNESAGINTSSLPSESARYVPLTGTEGPVGVLGIEPQDPKTFESFEQQRLLVSFAHQIALALEVDRYQGSAKKAEGEAETERLRSSLLSSISHDFRTPLTAIVGSASALLNRDEIKKSHSSRELAETIQEEGKRLSRLVQNLLETTRLESGPVALKKELNSLEEIIGSALERLDSILRQKKIPIDIPEDLPLIPMDALLVEQVLVNLLENAARHTPAPSPIHIEALAVKNEVQISIADQGPGIKDEIKDRIFDKFFKGESTGGAGLGLAICRAIVQAHGGKIWVENIKSGGAVFRFTLPLGK